MSTYFFPNIKRATKYDKKADESYHPYKYYLTQISTDCQNRCVYCDVMLGEIGHEGFHLDHFRPQKTFPELIDNPSNLVIACAKCNRWKSSHWPIDAAQKVSHNGLYGFIEPFETNRTQYFQVELNGELSHLKGPSQYMINLLHLNRPSRVLVRRNRLLSCKIDDLLNAAGELVVHARDLFVQGQSFEKAFEILDLAKNTIDQIQLLRGELNKT